MQGKDAIACASSIFVAQTQYLETFKALAYDFRKNHIETRVSHPPGRSLVPRRPTSQWISLV
jgi:hypothetical protein